MPDYSGILDVAIGIVFVYLLLSLLCSALTEMCEAWARKRGKNLWKGLTELLYDPQGNFVEKLYRDPLIYGLYKGDSPSEKSRNLPSYIPPHNFALALINLILNGKPLTFNHLRDGIEQASIPNGVKSTLVMLLDTAGNDLDKAIQNIEGWYNNAMERISGWYKRYAQIVSMFVGLFIAVVGNVDTITIANSLMNDNSLRAALVSAAQPYAQQADPKSIALPAGTEATDFEKLENEAQAICVKAVASARCLEKKAQAICAKEAASAECRYYTSLIQLGQLGLPIGWGTSDPRTARPEGLPEWFNKIAGLLLTGFAISFGAPFWFDILNKIMKFRSAVKPEPQTPAPPADKSQP